MILTALEARCLKHVVSKALGDMEQPTSLFSRLFAGQPSSKEKEAMAKEKDQKQAYLDLKNDLERTVEEMNFMNQAEDLEEAAAPVEEDPASAAYREQLYAIEAACQRVSGKQSGKLTDTGETKKSSMSVNVGDEMDLSFTPPPSTKSRNSSLNNQSAEAMSNLILNSSILTQIGESMKGGSKKSTSPNNSLKNGGSPGFLAQIGESLKGSKKASPGDSTRVGSLRNKPSPQGIARQKSGSAKLQGSMRIEKPSLMVNVATDEDRPIRSPAESPVPQSSFSEKASFKYQNPGSSSVPYSKSPDNSSSAACIIM